MTAQPPAPKISYPMVAISRDNRFFHAALTRQALLKHAVADATAWTSRSRTPSSKVLDLYDATGRVLVPVAGQGWLVCDLRATGDVVEPADLLARLAGVAEYVAARAPAAVDVPVPNPGERLRPYLKRLAEMIEEGGPAAQPLSGDDNGARHQRGSLHNLLHALFG